MSTQIALSRRRLLVGTVGVAVMSLSGCNDPGDDPDGATDDDPNENEGDDPEGEADDDGDNDGLHAPGR